MIILNKKISNFTLPLIALNIVQLIISQISLAIVSQGSFENLAGISSIENILFALAGILGAFSFGFNIKGSRALGQNNQENFLAYLAANIKINFYLGISFILMDLLFAKPILKYIYGFSGSMLENTTNFLLVMAPYLLLTPFSFTFTSLAKIEKKTKYIFWGSLLSGLLQLILSYIFVTKFKSILGAGLANILSLSFLVFFYTFLTRKTWSQVSLSTTDKIKDLARFSLPLLWQEILEGFLFIIIFEILMARLGVRTLAIYALSSQFLALVKMPSLMYGQAESIFIPESLGENKQNQRQIFKICLFSSYIYYLGFGLILFTFSKNISKFFLDNPKIIQELPKYLILVFTCSLSSPLYEISKYALQSLELENTVFKYTFLINLLAILSMTLVYINKQASFTSLFMITGLNSLILAGIFLKIFLQTTKKATLN